MSLGILAAGTLSNQGIATESAWTTDEHDRSGSMTSRNLKCPSAASPNAVLAYENRRAFAIARRSMACSL